MKQRLLILLFGMLMIGGGRSHDPPPTLIFDWGDISPDVKIWHSHSVKNRYENFTADSAKQERAKKISIISYLRWEPYKKQK